MDYLNITISYALVRKMDDCVRAVIGRDIENYTLLMKNKLFRNYRI